MVKSGSNRIIIGPTAQIIANDQSLRELAFQLDVMKDDAPVFVEGMKQIVRMPLESLLMMLCAVNYMLNGEKLELQDIAIQAETQNVIKQKGEERCTEKSYDAGSEPVIHNTLQLEETLMDIVRRGDTAALEQWVSTAPAIRAGVLAFDQLRQLRNTFIVTATLASRAAIRGGMAVEDAFCFQTPTSNVWNN